MADGLKAQQKGRGDPPPCWRAKGVALVFAKNSTRTRTSFEVGIYQLGGLGNYMNAATELQSGRGEPLKDTARVLGRYYDCVVWRTYTLSQFGQLCASVFLCQDQHAVQEFFQVHLAASPFFPADGPSQPAPRERGRAPRHTG